MLAAVAPNPTIGIIAAADNAAFAQLPSANRTPQQQPTARQYGVDWQSVDRACTRVFTEALAGTDPLTTPTSITVDQVKPKKAH